MDYSAVPRVCRDLDRPVLVISNGSARWSGFIHVETDEDDALQLSAEPGAFRRLSMRLLR